MIEKLNFENGSRSSDEFLEFIQSEKITPPEHLTENILAQVHSDLNPSILRVFSKLALVHAVVGTLTLLFCPQFGFGLSQAIGFGVGQSMGLMNIFMKFGTQVCTIGCGAIFLGASALVASLVLEATEVQMIRKTKFLQFLILGLLSLGIFIAVGAGVVAGLSLFWVFGSVLGGLLTLELGWKTRLYLRRQNLIKI